mmetsp:Transcript_4861/g.14665  ORF Transcript_4861/g.14665 Transcript_4861/m.14665 type:complete len:218 (+) Transcript_4861:64-717(+)
MQAGNPRELVCFTRWRGFLPTRGLFLQPLHRDGSGDKRPKVCFQVPIEIEVLLQPAGLENLEGVSTHRYNFALLEAVFFVEYKSLWRRRDGAPVLHGNSVVFRGFLQIVVSEESEGCRDEIDRLDFLCELGTVNGERFRRHKPHILKPNPSCKSDEIVPVHCTADTFSKENWVLSQFGGKLSERIHIGEVHLTAMFEHTIRLPKGSLFVGTEVDNTI